MQTTTYSETKTTVKQPSSVAVLRTAKSVRLEQRRASVSSPQAFTACVSEVSWSAPRRSHYQAVKSFAEVYAAYQAYLAPEQHPGADYDLAVGEADAHCGCLSSTLVGCVPTQSGLDEKAIEACGYLGWLQRC